MVFEVKIGYRAGDNSFRSKLVPSFDSPYTIELPCQLDVSSYSIFVGS